jgi:Flp pilus assembly protein TadB
MGPGEPRDAPRGSRDRHAYLEEQIARQRRGEPIDVEWVQAELARVRDEQARVTASVQRNLRLLVVLCAALLLVLWLKSGGFGGRGGVWTLGLIVIGALAAWVLGNRRK